MTHCASPFGRDVLALADRLRSLEAEHPRHLALAMLVSEQRSGDAEGPVYVTWQQAGIPRRTWYAWISSGRLQASKVGRVLLARRVDVDRVVASLAVERGGVSAKGTAAELDTAGAHLASMEREGLLEAGYA